MDGLTILPIIIIIITLLLLFYAVIYNRFQHYIIKIKAAEKNIDSTLRKKYDILFKMINIIEELNKDDDNIKKEFASLKEQSISDFDFDRKLIEYLNIIDGLKEKTKKIEDTPYQKSASEIKDIDESLIAYKKYYNDNITMYNKLVRMFPTNIVSKISRLKEKTYFDQKNTNDEITNDFKL